jgi:hypothetical protein
VQLTAPHGTTVMPTTRADADTSPITTHHHHIATSEDF